VGWAVASLLLVLGGLLTWSYGVDLPLADVAGPGLTLAGLVGVWWSLSAPEGLDERGQLAILLGLGVVLVYRALSAYSGDPSYGTDGAAFDQYAAQLLIAGHNPYSASMAPAASLFHVPSLYRTFRLDGAPVDSLSYPAGAFLAYVPLLVAGVRTQLANIVDLTAWFAGAVLLWRLLPRAYCWLAALPIGIPLYSDFVIGGGTDALWVPFLVVAMWRWDRYGDPDEMSVARWIGPLALGAAMSIKQIPWFALPFLLVGIGLETQSRGAGVAGVLRRYLLSAGSVFTAVNLPFVVWSPGDWVHGILVPLVQPLIPDGQGLVNLTLGAGRGGGLLVAYSIAALALYVLLLLAYLARPGALKRGWPILVAVVFFIPARSFATYMIMPLPAALVAALSVGPAVVAAAPRSRWLRPGLVVAGVVFLVAGAAAVALPGPLSLRVLGTTSTGQLQTIDEITVEVGNRTNHTVRPHFSVLVLGHTTSFWYAFDGRRAGVVILPAHASVAVQLRAPNTQATVPIRSGFVVEAFTTGPAAVSTASVQRPQVEAISIEPAAVEAPIRVGQRVALTAQLEDRYGGAIHRAGVVVALAQVVYSEDALVPGEASINGQTEGQSPVQATTDAHGAARFTITAAQAQLEPVNFQAWIATPGTAPFGYSNQVSVQFVP
jgi:uncharacterized membrane protein